MVKLYAHEHELLFGEIVSGRMVLSRSGQVAADEWLRSAIAYPDIDVDSWAVHPDRLEGIVRVHENSSPDGYLRHNKKPRLLTAFIASYKAAAAKRINLLRNEPGRAVWQRGYQERLIPDAAALHRMRRTLRE